MARPQNDQMNLRLAKLEKSAISFIDDYSASRTVRLSTVIDHCSANAKDDIRAHIGENIEKFIKSRNYEWKLNEDEDPILVRQSPEIRLALLQILRLIQRVCNEKHRGVYLQDIATFLANSFPKLKKTIGKNLDSVKRFLNEYPSLFLMDPFYAGRAGPSTWFVNRALAMDDNTIVLSKEDGKSFQTPMYLKGRCNIKFMTAYHGFVNDQYTKQDAYFSKHVAFPESKEDSLFSIVKKGQRYSFEAIVNPNYGNVKNKWTIFRMEPDISPKTLKNSKLSTGRKSSQNEDTRSTPGSTRALEENDLGQAASTVQLPDLIDQHAEGDENPNDEENAKGEENPEDNKGQNETMEKVLEPKEIPQMAVQIPRPKKSVACQTEFNDDQELLLRMLRKCPEFFSMVKAVRGGLEKCSK